DEPLLGPGDPRPRVGLERGPLRRGVVGGVLRVEGLGPLVADDPDELIGLRDAPRGRDLEPALQAERVDASSPSLRDVVQLPAVDRIQAELPAGWATGRLGLSSLRHRRSRVLTGKDAG